MLVKSIMRRRLTHLDHRGSLQMVNVGGKPVTLRRAVAEGKVKISSRLAKMISRNSLPKGDLIATVRLAGIQAAKRTSELIPLCHNIPIDQVGVEARVVGNSVALRATVISEGKTGVEMEALTAVAVAALTVVDMGKSVDRTMVIGPIRLLEKTGGRHGKFVAPPLENGR
jgi:cyclic pyranopterin monophosphate synthase